MRKSKLITTLLIVVILVLSLSSVLVACDWSKKDGPSGDVPGSSVLPPPPTGSDDDDNTTNQVYYDQMGLLKKIIGAIEVPEPGEGEESKDALSIDLEMEATSSKNEKTIIAVKGNFFFNEDEEAESLNALAQSGDYIYPPIHNELAFIVKQPAADVSQDKILFGLYMVDDKMYLDLGEGKDILFLEDFNPNYVISLLKSGIGKLPELLGSIDQGTMDMINTFLPIILGVLFDQPVATLREDGGQDITMKIKLDTLIQDISELLTSMIELPVDLSPLLNFLDSLIPKATYNLNTSFDSAGKMTYLGAEMNDIVNAEKGNLDINLVIDDEKVVTGMPEIDTARLKNFSFTNIQFAIDLSVGTQTELINDNGEIKEIPKRLDIGKLANSLLGSFGVGGFKLPEGLLMLEGGTGVRLAFALDLDLNYRKENVDNNKIAIELFLINKDGTVAEKDSKGNPIPQIGIYYTEGSLYLNLDNMLPNYMKGVNIRVDTDLSKLINVLVDMITDAIDKALGTDFDKTINAGIKVGNDGSLSFSSSEALDCILESSNAGVLSLSKDAESGDFVINAGFKTFIEAVAIVLGMPKNLIVDGNTISIIVDNDLFKAINSLAGKDLGIKLPDAITKAQLNINLFDKGLESVAVEATLDSVLDVDLRVHQFLIGFEDPDLDERIEKGVGGESTSYINSLGGAIETVLGGVMFSSHFNLNFGKNKYNLAPLIASFGLPQLANTDIIWEFDDAFKLDASLNVQISLDRNKPSDSIIAFELKAEEDGIAIGGRKIFEKNTVIVGIYGYNNSIYIDLSNFKIANITLPKLKFDLRFTEIVYSLVDGLLAQLLESMNIEGGDFVFDFDLSELLGLGGAATEPASNSGALAMADAEEGGSTKVDPEIAAIVLGVNTDMITPFISMASIMALLKALNVELGADLVEVLGLMDVEIGMKMGRKDGFEFTIKGDLVPILDTSYGEGRDGISVLYFDTNNNKLPTHDDSGKRIVYKKGEYSYKKYVYGDKMNLLLELGTEKYPVKIGELPADKKFDMAQKAEEFNSYTSDLVQAIMDTVGTGQIKLSMDLITHDNDMDLTKLINNILANMGKRLEIPINLSLDDWRTNVELALEWDIDLTSSARSAIKLELRYGADADKNLSGKTIIGIYIYRNALIIDLEGLGFFRAKLVNSGIIDKVFKVLEGYVEKIDNLDLSKIIDDLLKDAGLPTLPSEGATGGNNSDIATDGNVPTVGEGLEVMDLIEYILQAVSLENTAIMLDFPSTLINTLLKELLGINLGIDFSLGGQLDVFGESFKLDIGVEDLEVQARIDLNVGGEVNIEVDFERIPSWDATSGSLLAQTMLDNLDLGLTLDFANYTADTGQVNNDNGKVFTRIIIEKVGSNGKRLINTDDNNLIPEGMIVVTLAHISEECYNNNEKGNYTPILYVVLDYKATSNQLKLFLCKNVVNLVIDFAQVVKDIGINLDLLGMLGGMFDDLFKNLDGMFDGLASDVNQAQTQSLATADADSGSGDELKGFDKILAELDITQLLSAGINVSLRSNGNFNADIAFDPYTINKLIDDVLSMIFSGGTGNESMLNLATLAPTMFTEDHLGKVVWTRMRRGTDDDKSSFWGSLRQEVPNILAAVLNSLSPGLGGFNGIANGVYSQIRNILSGLLPFAVFNELHVGVNVIDATLANIYIEGDDNYEEIKDPNGKVVYGLDSDARNENYYTHITLYNMFGAVGKPSTSIDGSTTGVVTWDDIPSQLTFAPYTYESVSKGVEQIIAQHFTDKVASYQNGNMTGSTDASTVGAIIKTAVTFKIIAEADGHGGSISCSPKDISNLNLEAAGKYVIEARAQFTNTIYRTMTVTIDALGEGGGITSIEPIQMHVYDYNEDPEKANFPDFITANMGDGTQRLINTKYLQFVDAAPTKYDQDYIVDAKVRFPREGQQDVPIKITYLDSSVSEIIVNGTAIGGDNEYPRLVIDLYDYDLRNSSIEDYISDVFYFKYKDGKAVGIDINREWDVSAAEDFFNREIGEDGYSKDVRGEAFGVSTSIGEGAVEQEVKLVIWIKTKKVTRLTINGLENTVKVDPYMYYMYLITGDEQYNPFPTTAMANYHDVYPGVLEDTIIDDNDGVAEEVNIVWNKDEYKNVDFGYMSNQDTEHEVNVRLDNSKYAGNFTWEFPTTMIVMRNQIQAVYFDPEGTENPSQSTLFIDPFKYRLNVAEGLDNFPDSAYILFTNGSMRRMPIRWKGLETFKVEDYDSKFQQLSIEIGFDIDGKLSKEEVPETYFKQTAFVNVKVENLVPLGLDIAGSDYSKEHGGDPVYYIDPIQVLYYGMPAFPSTVTMVYSGDRTSELPISNWEFNMTDITLKGKKGLQAVVEVAKGYTYRIDVEVIDRWSLESMLKYVEIDPYKYEVDANGSRIYKNFASSAQLRQLVGNLEIDFETKTVNTDCVKQAATGKSEDKAHLTYVEYVVTYKRGINSESMTETFRDKDSLEDFIFGSENMTIESAVAYEYFNVNTEWDLTEINYAVPDVYTVKMVTKSIDGNADKTFKVDVNVKAKKVKYVGSTNYYLTINVGGSNLTNEEKMTKLYTRNINVMFEDESYGTYECTIDLSTIDFDTYSVTVEDEVYKDRSGKTLSDQAAIAAAGESVNATVCSGDIAQQVKVKVIVLLTIEADA